MNVSVRSQKAYQALHLVSVKRRHGGLLCWLRYCVTMTAGSPVGSAQVQVRRRLYKRQLVTRMSCDSGRRVWPMLAEIRGVGHVDSSRRSHMKGDAGFNIWLRPSPSVSDSGQGVSVLRNPQRLDSGVVKP